MLNTKLSNLIKSVKIVQPFLKKKKSLVQLYVCVCVGGGGVSRCKNFVNLHT